MARCGCANGACSCKITGEGIDVTGFGTVDSPYVLSTGDTVTVVPLTGSTVAIAAGTRTELIQPAGTLAALTITLPDTSDALDDEVVIVTTAILTALTVSPASGASTVAGMPTTLAANGFLRVKRIGTVWRRVG